MKTIFTLFLSIIIFNTCTAQTKSGSDGKQRVKKKPVKQIQFQQKKDSLHLKNQYETKDSSIKLKDTSAIKRNTNRGFYNAPRQRPNPGVHYSGIKHAPGARPNDGNNHSNDGKKHNQPPDKKSK